MDGRDTDCDELADEEDPDACPAYTGWPEANHEMEHVADETIVGTLNSYFGAGGTIIDLDLDGKEDVLIASYGNSMVYGYLNATVRSGVPLDEADADYVINLTLGIATLANAGDVDGDGHDDLLIGNASYESRQGRAYLFLSGGLSAIMSEADADYTFSAEDNDSRFGAVLGSAVAGLGDVDGDGLSDILIGASLDDGVGLLYGGAAYLYLSSSLGAKPILYTGDSDHVFYGSETYMGVGYDIDAAGDVDGNGTPDFLIGNYGTWGDTTGEAHLFLGESLGEERVIEIGQADHVFTIADETDGLGARSAGVGDVDGDGLADILLGAHGADSAGEDAGAT